MSQAASSKPSPIDRRIWHSPLRNVDRLGRNEPMTWAMTHPLPQMLDVDNAAAVVYACEGQPALALLNAMELVSNQTIDGDVVARRAGSIVCSSHRSHGLTICTITIEATAPFAKQVR